MPLPDPRRSHLGLDDDLICCQSAGVMAWWRTCACLSHCLPADRPSRQHSLSQGVAGALTGRNLWNILRELPTSVRQPVTVAKLDQPDVLKLWPGGSDHDVHRACSRLGRRVGSGIRSTSRALFGRRCRGLVDTCEKKSASCNPRCPSSVDCSYPLRQICALILSSQNLDSLAYFGMS